MPGESDKCDGIAMDPLIAAAARALAAGDPLAALKRVALLDEPQALALRGIAMAQLGDFPCARALLRRAARAFRPDDAVALARCVVAEAEVALVSRDLGGSTQALGAARNTLEEQGDRANGAHAGYLEARLLLLIGRLDAAEQTLRGLDADALPPASRAGYWLVAAGIAMRRIRAEPASRALDRARHAAREAAIPALMAEVAGACRALDAPAARLIAAAGQQPLGLAEVEALIASGALVIDACRGVARSGTTIIPLSGRPVLFGLARALAEAWPDDVPRETLIARAFRARQTDDAHRARLRVEIGRLRTTLRPLAGVSATHRGFLLKPHHARAVAALAPPVEESHPDMMALLADGESWSSSALAAALNVSSRTVQRVLGTLVEAGMVERYGRGRACQWVAPKLPGFPSSLLLPASLESR